MVCASVCFHLIGFVMLLWPDLTLSVQVAREYIVFLKTSLLSGNILCNNSFTVYLRVCLILQLQQCIRRYKLICRYVLYW